MSNVTRSATRTIPAGPPRNGLIPKSVCFTANAATARSVSCPISTRTSTDSSRVWPTIVSSASMRYSPSDGVMRFDASVISGYWSTLRMSVRIASVTLRISCVRRREDLQAVGADHDLDAGQRRRTGEIHDPAGESPGADQMLVAGEAEQPGLASLNVQPAGGREAVDDRVAGGGLAHRGGGEYGERCE